MTDDVEQQRQNESSLLLEAHGHTTHAISPIEPPGPDSSGQSPQPLPTTTTLKKKRGRPPKVVADAVSIPESSSSVSTSTLAEAHGHMTIAEGLDPLHGSRGQRPLDAPNLGQIELSDSLHESCGICPLNQLPLSPPQTIRPKDTEKRKRGRPRLAINNNPAALPPLKKKQKSNKHKKTTTTASQADGSSPSSHNHQNHENDDGDDDDEMRYTNGRRLPTKNPKKMTQEFREKRVCLHLRRIYFSALGERRILIFSTNRTYDEETRAREDAVRLFESLNKQEMPSALFSKKYVGDEVCEVVHVQRTKKRKNRKRHKKTTAKKDGDGGNNDEGADDDEDDDNDDEDEDEDDTSSISEQ